ncbi:hypothetical protein LINPERHAP2_LOCUS14199 [Linum perenne]
MYGSKIRSKYEFRIRSKYGSRVRFKYEFRIRSKSFKRVRVQNTLNVYEPKYLTS